MKITIKSNKKEKKLIDEIRRLYDEKLKQDINVKLFYDHGRISDEEYKKYMLSSDPCYLPSLRKNDSKT